jgi:hypothetical protein
MRFEKVRRLTDNQGLPHTDRTVPYELGKEFEDWEKVSPAPQGARVISRSKMVAILESGDFGPIGQAIAHLCSVPLRCHCFHACAAERTVVP